MTVHALDMPMRGVNPRGSVIDDCIVIPQKGEIAEF